MDGNIGCKSYLVEDRNPSSPYELRIFRCWMALTSYQENPSGKEERERVTTEGKNRERELLPILARYSDARRATILWRNSDCN
ncbi:unnamed protein product [Dovyalis caffra]|uniref:Uncharacterized protein n=1 Tax=Dovyalis caffra TaxID=77055 RepID=A0AAV1S995_9ROSI|nr:unnamed protein product [Dovyalis caffra]